MRRGIFVAPFDELSDPRLVADLAVRAEQRGWDGFFLDPAPWFEAGATWCLTGFGPQPTRAEVERAIDGA